MSTLNLEVLKELYVIVKKFLEKVTKLPEDIRGNLERNNKILSELELLEKQFSKSKEGCSPENIDKKIKEYFEATNQTLFRARTILTSRIKNCVDIKNNKC